MSSLANPSGDDATEPSRRVAAALPSASSLRVVDLGVGMAAALVAKQLAEFGAQVSRIEPPTGDPFYELYPAYRFWRRNARMEAVENLDRLIDEADICIIGGEHHPSISHAYDAAALRVSRPRLIVVDMSGRNSGESAGTGGGGPPAVDLLVQASTGAVYEQFSDGPVAAGLPLASYGAVLLAGIEVWAALIDRTRAGRGRTVSVSLAAGLALFWSPFWMTAERPDAAFSGITPRDVKPLLLQSSDGHRVQITMGVPGAEAAVHAALGIDGPVDPHSRGLPRPELGAARFYGDVDLYDRHARSMPLRDLIGALRSAGIPAEPVLAPGANWDDAQVRTLGMVVDDGEGWSGVGTPLHLTAGIAAAPPTLPPRADAGPLSGIRVVDFGIFVAGPFAAKLLADLGADVIHVEPPTTRSTLSGERTIIAANFGKRSICIDLKAPDSRPLVESLCRTADVALHNFRPGVAARLGLDPASLRAINPSIVTLETSAYGSEGPKRDAPGFDMVLQACSGLQSRAGGEGRSPVCSRTPIIDFAAGAIGAIGLLAALFERTSSGRPTAVATSLLQAGLFLTSEAVKRPGGAILGVPLLDGERRGFHPAERLYRAADGDLALSARSLEASEALARVLAITLPMPWRNWGPAERERIAAAIAGRGVAELVDRMTAAGVPAACCVADGWSAPPLSQVLTGRLVDPSYGDVTHCLGVAARCFGMPPAAPRRLAVPSGIDGRQILEELGYSPAETRLAFDRGALHMLEAATLPAATEPGHADR